MPTWASKDSAVCLSYPRSPVSHNNLTISATDKLVNIIEEKQTNPLSTRMLCLQLKIHSWGIHLIFLNILKKRGLSCYSELKRVGSSVTFEQILPSSLRERGAHRLKIKTSTVISCSSGCFPKKSGDMNCIFHPLQSWLSRASLSVAFMFHGGLRNKPPKRRNRRGADQLCVVFV